ncbi:hypothetical protein EVAR_95616_1 [Eumeta japonica]|uniref:Uncharacterized protein n=1 Tax=Eumeta variegata TaxID=151549 RepID=A0A4C1VJ39_EUMVA|nr:hypothetical protein EVAR_95616_1 [Eumeta japonica]
MNSPGVFTDADNVFACALRPYLLNQYGAGCRRLLLTEGSVVATTFPRPSCLFPFKLRNIARAGFLKAKGELADSSQPSNYEFLDFLLRFFRPSRSPLASVARFSIQSVRLCGRGILGLQTLNAPGQVPGVDLLNADKDKGPISMFRLARLAKPLTAFRAMKISMSVTLEIVAAASPLNFHH